MLNNINVRVIPCLLLQNDGIVKSIKFKDHKYIGDPINSVRLFNEKEVDELVFLDISARPNKKGPNFKLLTKIASEAFMPFSYGGGIRDLDDAKKLFSIGLEKLIFNTISFESPEIISQTAKIFGSSAVVASVDVKRSLLGKYSVLPMEGLKNTGVKAIDYVKHLEQLGAGEIILNSIDRDGTMKGYDLKLIHDISCSVSIPIVSVGGAGNLKHFNEAILSGASAVGAGSIFVYYGKHRAVLITYPPHSEIQTIGK